MPHPPRPWPRKCPAAHCRTCTVKWGSPELQAQYGHLSPEELRAVGQKMLEEERAGGAGASAAATRTAAAGARAERRRMRHRAQLQPEGELIGTMQVQTQGTAP
jgi:hypothetical protein